MRKIIYPFLILFAASFLVVTNTGCTAKAKKAYHLHRANQYFDSGQYDRAEIEYINVLRNDRQNVEAISRLGVIYFEEGNFQRAAPFLFKGRELATNDLNLHLKSGFIYLAIGKPKEARDEANFVLDRKPQDEDAPILLAQAAITQKDIEDTRGRLQKLSQAGDRASFEVALGALSFRERDFKTAATAFERAQTLDPKSGAANEALGALHWVQNDLKQAETAFKTAADLSPSRSPRRLTYAQFEIQTGNLEAGKNVLDEIVKAAPDYIPAWIGLAEIALSEKKFDEGAAALNKVLAQDRGNYDALLLSGQLHLAQGETAQAITELEKMAQLFPQAPRVHYLLATAYLVNDDSRNAVNSLNQAVNLDTNYVEAIVLLAQVEIKNGDLDPAIVSLKPLVQRQPRLTQAQLLLADAYRAQDHTDDALAIYQQLEELFPQNPQIPLLMGSTFVQRKENVEARKQFARTLELAPNSLPALEQLVDLDLNEKQFAAAQQRIEGAIEKNPKLAELRLLSADLFIVQGETNQAQASLLQAVELDPQSPSAYLSLAQLYFDSKQNEKALAALNTMLSMDAKNVSALMLMGTFQSELKNYQAAADAYERLLEVNPKFSPALNNLAYLYCENLNQLDRAYELAQRVRQLLPDDASTADTLGWILLKKGQYPSALSLLQEAANKLPGEPEIQFHLGMACYMMDDEAGARAAFQGALQLKNDFIGRAECNRYLSLLAIDPKTATPADRAALEKRIAEKSDDPVALSRLASIYERDGNFDKETVTYEAVLRANPQNSDAMIKLAQLYAPKDSQKAFDLAKAAYKFAPNDPEIGYTLGHLAYQIGNYKLAVSLLQQAAQNQPDNPKILYDFAEAAYSVGKISDAQTAMQGALQAGLTSPESEEASRLLDMINLSANPSLAVAAKSRVEEILKSNPDYVPALMASAVIAEQDTNYDLAAAAYEKVLKHNPDFVVAQKKLAVIYSQETGMTEKAYALAIKAREAFPNDSEIAKTLGVVVFQQGDYARAVKLLQEGAIERIGDAELFYYLGAAQYQLKNMAESKISLQRALDLNLSGKQLAEAKRILSALK
jgi:tetratricopeptide (TPR) repeat protein